MLNDYLQTLGLSEKEIRVVLVLAEIGVQPASAAARRAGIDRVTTYKILRRLSERGLARIYFRDSVQCFGLENLDILEGQLKERAHEALSVAEKFPVAAELLRSLGGKSGAVPKLQMFEGTAGMRGLLRDLLSEVREAKIDAVRILTSNTYEEHIDDTKLKTELASFYKELRKQSVAVEFLEATGGMVSERLQKLPDEALQERLLQAQGMTNVLIAGTAVYLISFSATPIGLKVKHHDLSQIFHFMFDALGGMHEAKTRMKARQT